MALITCPECKKRISDSTDSCPKCGYKLTPEIIAEIRKKELQAQKGCGIGCLSIIVIIITLYSFGSNSSRNDSLDTFSQTRIPSLQYTHIKEVTLGKDRLIVGKKYKGDDLMKIIDKHFPNADYLSNESIMITFEGKDTRIHTRKLNYSGPAYYEITKIYYITEE